MQRVPIPSHVAVRVTSLGEPDIYDMITHGLSKKAKGWIKVNSLSVYKDGLYKILDKAPEALQKNYGEQSSSSEEFVPKRNMNKEYFDQCIEAGMAEIDGLELGASIETEINRLKSLIIQSVKDRTALDEAQPKRERVFDMGPLPDGCRLISETVELKNDGLSERKRCEGFWGYEGTPPHGLQSLRSEEIARMLDEELSILDDPDVIVLRSEIAPKGSVTLNGERIDVC